MKISALITKSTQYAEYLYTRRPGLRDKPFDNQHEAFVDDTFGGSEIWSSGLLKFGYQSQRIYSNVPSLQKRWALEQGIGYSETSWIEEISLAQMKRYKPELLFVSNHNAFTPEYIKTLRIEVPSIKLILGWCGSPYNNQSIFSQYDIVLSNIPELVTDLNQAGFHCFHLNHGFDPRALERINRNNNMTEDFTFLGSVVKATEFHNEREILLIKLLELTELKVYSSVGVTSKKQKAKTILIDMLFWLQKRLGLINSNNRYANKISKMKTSRNFDNQLNRNIIKKSNPPVFGVDMFQKLNDSKITFNNHIDFSKYSASNMRIFEATGVGTCLLTDWKDNLKDLFEPEFEVVTYRNPAECIEKVNYLLENESERKAVAEAGQRRTLENHTIYQRAEELNEIIRKQIR
jgi:spore maturation protein CgeB